MAVHLNYHEALAKAKAAWDPAKHPRGRDGKYIETGAFVQIFSGVDGPQINSGKVVASHYASDGRIFIGVDTGDGATSWYRPKQIQSVNTKAWLPDGKDPVSVDSGTPPSSPLPAVDEKYPSINWVDKPDLSNDTAAHPPGFQALLDSGATDSTPPTMSKWDPDSIDWVAWLDEHGFDPQNTDVAIASTPDGAAPNSFYVSSYAGTYKWSYNPDTGESTVLAAHAMSDGEYTDQLISGDLAQLYPPEDQGFGSLIDDVDATVNESMPTISVDGVPNKWQDPEGLYIYLPEKVADAVANAYPIEQAKVYKRDGGLGAEWAVVYPDDSVGLYDKNGDWIAAPAVDWTPAELEENFNWYPLVPAVSVDVGTVSPPSTLDTSADGQAYYNQDTGSWYFIDEDGGTQYVNKAGVGNMLGGPNVDFVQSTISSNPWVPVYPLSAAHDAYTQAEPPADVPSAPTPTTAPAKFTAQLVGQLKTLDPAFNDFYVLDTPGARNWLVSNGDSAFKYDANGNYESHLGSTSAILESALQLGYKKVVPSVANPSVVVEADSHTPPVPELTFFPPIPGPMIPSAEQGDLAFNAETGNWAIGTDDGSVFLYGVSGTHKAHLNFDDAQQVYSDPGWMKVDPETWGKPPPDPENKPPIPLSLWQYADDGSLMFNTKTGGWAIGKDDGSVSHYAPDGEYKSTAGSSGAITQFENPEWVSVNPAVWGIPLPPTFDAPIPADYEPPVPALLHDVAANGDLVYNTETGDWANEVHSPGFEGYVYIYNADGEFMWSFNYPSAGDKLKSSEWKSVGPDWGKVNEPTPTAPSASSYQPIKLPAGKTAGDLIAMIATSYANKNTADKPLPLSNGSFEFALQDWVLNESDYDTALKKLNDLMTMAKLGGKQRARYKTLLLMHFGKDPEPGTSPKSAVIGDPGHWRKVLADKPFGSPSIGAVKGNKLVQSGGDHAGAAKSNIQTQLSARLRGRVTSQQLINAVIDSEYDSPQHLIELARHVQKALDTGETLQGTLRKDYNGQWKYAEHETIPGIKGATVAPSLTALEDALLESMTSAMVQLWAQTSNDSNVRSLAMQKAAEDEFGLKGTFQWAQMVGGTEAEYKKHGALYREFLRVMYENTQEWGKANGVSHVRLLRGMGPHSNSSGAGIGDAHALQLRPLSSFSSNLGTTKSFGSYVVEAYVPLEWIIGTAATGFGCRNEYEWVILGGVHQVRRVQ